LIVLDFFKFNNPEEFKEEYNFSNIEPFTLIIIYKKSLKEFKWDGKRTYLIKHNYNEPKIWSSVTLYTSDAIKQRESWFNELITHRITPSMEDIIDFHFSAGNGKKENSILMERKALSIRTVSITSISRVVKIINMKYMDLLRNETYIETLLL
jgi:hypothetical protein